MDYKTFLKEIKNNLPKQIDETFTGTDFKITYQKNETLKGVHIKDYKLDVDFDWFAIHTTINYKNDSYIMNENYLDFLNTDIIEKVERTLNNIITFKYTIPSLVFKLGFSVKGCKFTIDDKHNISASFNFKPTNNSKQITCNDYMLTTITDRSFFTSNGNVFYISFLNDDHASLNEDYTAENVQPDGTFDLYKNGSKTGAYNIFNEDDLFYLKMKEII